MNEGLGYLNGTFRKLWENYGKDLPESLLESLADDLEVSSLSLADDLILFIDEDVMSYSSFVKIEDWLYSHLPKS